MREANGGKQAAKVGLKRSDVLAAIKKVRGVSEGYPRHKRLHIRYLFQWPFPADP